MTVPETTLDLVEHWRQQLVPEWRIIVVDEIEEPGEIMGRCEIDDRQYQQATIYLDPDLADDPGFEATVIHELLHVLIDPLCSQISRLAMEAGTSGMAAEHRLRQDNEERIVERLARVLAGDKAPYGTVAA